MQRQEVETLLQQLKAEIETLKKKVAKLEKKTAGDWDDWESEEQDAETENA